MAFSKTKHLEAAQKYLGQGKLVQAISEYEQILKQEPKDQVTLMTIGDLCVRAGDSGKALDFFERLGQVFLTDGFNSKAIAIYKKIAKLAPDATHPLEKLAELYVQQGVMSEARPLYLQIAEAHLRAGRTEKAVETLRMLVDIEPENMRVQLRLAELYQSIGQSGEAAHAFLNCAHRMLDGGNFSEAQKFADLALKADPNNAHGMHVKARATAAQGKVEEAIALLEKLPEASSGTDTTQLLLGFYQQARQVDKAVGLARKTFSEDRVRYPMVYELVLNLLDSGEAEKAVDLLGEIRETMLEATDYDKLSQALTTAADRLHGRIEPLEWLVDCYRRASDSFRLPQALDQLAEAAAASGQLDKAKRIFEELYERAPEDEDVRRRLNQIRARLGEEPVGPEETPVAVKSAPAGLSAPPAAATSAVPVDEGIDDETARFVNQALTDVDLFSSYGLTQKAIDLLESALKRAPRHTGVLEKLLDLHLGAGNDRRTSELANILQQVYSGRGDSGRAERFAELQRRYQRAAGMAADAPAPPPAPVQEFAVEAAAPPADESAVPEAAPAEAASEEVDLSDEWAALSASTSEEAPAAAAEVASEAAEVAGETGLEISPEEAPAAEAPATESAAEAPPVSFSFEPVTESPAPPAAAEAPAPVAEPEEDYVLEEQPAAVEAASAVEAPLPADQFMSELAAEVDSLQLTPPAATVAAPSAGAGPVPSATAAAPPAGKAAEQLKEVFDEFRSELGQMGEDEGEDLETHYNLGIAYREMGLLEEAIGEFQKVAKAVQGGQPFRYAMQCYTLLGLSFMDKGQPNIAAIWYDRALGTPDLDQESVMALRYDLGVAQELAGENRKALDSFTQVYAMNIDYRDVADRIASLQKRG